MVSKDEILGLRERILDGVDGMDEPDENEYAGCGSLNLAESANGEGCVDCVMGLVLPQAFT